MKKTRKRLKLTAEAIRVLSAPSDVRVGDVGIKVQSLVLAKGGVRTPTEAANCFTESCPPHTGSYNCPLPG